MFFRVFYKGRQGRVLALLGETQQTRIQQPLLLTAKLRCQIQGPSVDHGFAQLQWVDLDMHAQLHQAFYRLGHVAM